MSATISVLTPDSAFEDFFLREYAQVVAVAYRILGDRSDAEDVAQETFARVARIGTQYSGGALQLIAARRALNLLRGRRRRIAREINAFRLQFRLVDAAQRDADPLAQIDREQQRALVRAAMLRLKRRDAEILALRYGGASYRDVAAILRIDAAQVGVRLARAENAFKREIERVSFD